MAHWVDKRAARAAIVHALMARPETWQVFGYKADQSDPMTDYYNPADWYEGAAIHKPTGMVLVVDRYQGNTTGTRDRVRYVPDPASPCLDCQGTGKNDSKDIGRRNLAMRYGIAPDDCIPCHGRGLRDKPENYAEPFVRYQANPKGRSWHIERDGAIVASGVGVFSIAEKGMNQEKPLAEAFVAKIESTIARLTGAKPVSSKTEPEPIAHVAAPPGVTIQTGKPGNLEIRFTAKPSAEIRAELKWHGYRWHGGEGVWYGPEAKLPTRYRPEPATAV